MSSFERQEEDGRVYLIYEKDQDDKLDNLTVEMLSNNKIPGTVPISFIRINDKLTIKYDITGLKELNKTLEGVVKKKKILGVFESIADNLLEAEDYMLNLSSYLIDRSQMFVEPETERIKMIVLPIERTDVKIQDLLGRLLLGITYDQSEECGYIAALINMFNDHTGFSIRTLKDKLKMLNEEETAINRSSKENQSGYYEKNTSAPDPKPWEDPNRKTGVQDGEKNGGKDSFLPKREYHIADLERKKNIDVLFSDDSVEKEKKRFWIPGRKKEDKKEEKEGEKKKKRSIFGRKKDKEESQISDSPNPFAGMNIPGREPIERRSGEEQSEINRILIPSQVVKMEKYPVEDQDFGATEILDDNDDTDQTLLLDDPNSSSVPRYILVRLKTGESYPICGDVVRIGRKDTVSEICITGNPGIGRLHAILYVYKGQVYIEDNNSKNKTYVDDKVLEPGESPRLLLSGSKIRLADEEFEIRIGK